MHVVAYRLVESTTQWADLSSMGTYCKEIAQILKRVAKLSDDVVTVNKVGFGPGWECWRAPFAMTPQ